VGLFPLVHQGALLAAVGSKELLIQRPRLLGNDREVEARNGAKSPSAISEAPAVIPVTAI
jgi:hypothetical protein